MSKQLVIVAQDYKNLKTDSTDETQSEFNITSERLILETDKKDLEIYVNTEFIFKINDYNVLVKAEILYQAEIICDNVEILAITQNNNVITDFDTHSKEIADLIAAKDYFENKTTNVNTLTKKSLLDKATQIVNSFDLSEILENTHLHIINKSNIEKEKNYTITNNKLKIIAFRFILELIVNKKFSITEDYYVEYYNHEDSVNIQFSSQENLNIKYLSKTVDYTHKSYLHYKHYCAEFLKFAKALKILVDIDITTDEFKEFINKQEILDNIAQKYNKDLSEMIDTKKLSQYLSENNLRY